MTRTYRDKGWAVLWTGVSTLVGFASLAVSPVGPVRTLGIWAGFGIAAMTLFAFLVYPALCTRFKLVTLRLKALLPFAYRCL